MTGERTADLTRVTDSGSSDNDISLREHVQRQIDAVNFATDRALAAALSAAERLDVEQDRRYEQRFTAQENAVQLALTRVDKEFHEHIAQVRTETHAALEAADKAIAKSEASVEKRFESVNEFRGQLNDQARTFMGRDESISRHERTTEMIAALTTRNENEMRLLRERFEEDIRQLRDREQNDIATVNSRLDLTQGRGAGMDKTVAWIFAAAGFIGTIIAIIYAVSATK